MMNTKNASHSAEHHFRKVIPGNIDTVRQKLCDVLEDFGYIVLSENPLQARRPARHNMITANVLEYDTQLTIALKSLSQASPVAPFNYSMLYTFPNGERLALEREPERII